MARVAGDRKLRAFVWVSATTFALDVATKSWVTANFAPGEMRTALDGVLYFTYVTNPGAAFSMFADASPAFRRFLFVGVGGLAIAMVFWFYRSLSPGDRLAAIGLGGVLGGALGNLFDRVIRTGGEGFGLGPVVDWLHIRIGDGTSWPDFNLADVFVVCGVGVLVFELFASEAELAGDDPLGSEDGDARDATRSDEKSPGEVD